MTARAARDAGEQGQDGRQQHEGPCSLEGQVETVVEGPVGGADHLVDDRLDRRIPVGGVLGRTRRTP